MSYFIMSGKEDKLKSLLENYLQGGLTQKQVGEAANLSERQVRNRLKAFKEEGTDGLLHKNRGRKSQQRWNQNEVQLMIDLLASDDFKDFPPTLTSEKLLEIYTIKVSKETVRKYMVKAGYWVAKSTNPKHRRRRERKLCLGMMIQFDGSDHDWFEGRAPCCTLLVFIDDATSRFMWLEFVKSESTENAMRSTQNYINTHGRPQSLYVDYHSVFRVNLNNPDHEKLSQYERALAEADIKIIHARSPQAKGRVERVNRTLQDRLVKELRLKKSALSKKRTSMYKKNILPNIMQSLQ